MKKNLLIIGGLLVAVLSSFGVKKYFDFQDARSEVQSYVKENVFPEVKEKRLVLENELTEEEKIELIEIRSALKSKFPSRRKRFGRGSDLTQDEINDIRVERKEMRHLMNRAWEIADAHETIIYKQIDELLTHKEKWRDAIHGILEENGVPTEIIERKKGKMRKGEGNQNRPRSENGFRPDHHRRHNSGHDGDFGGGIGGKCHGRMGVKALMQMRSPVIFLLLDPLDDNLGLPEKLLDKQSGNQSPRKPGKVGISPNPTNNLAVLKFENPFEGQVTIVVMTRDGQMVETVFDGQLTQGEHEVSINTSNYTQGVYIVKIESGDQKMVRRLAVRK